MSYVDALMDRERDRIHVVERVNGRREYRDYQHNTSFTMMTPGASSRPSMARL